VRCPKCGGPARSDPAGGVVIIQLPEMQGPDRVVAVTGIPIHYCESPFCRETWPQKRAMDALHVTLFLLARDRERAVAACAPWRLAKRRGR